MSLRNIRAATSLPDGESVGAYREGAALLLARRENGDHMRFPDHASYLRYLRGRAQVQLRQQYRISTAVRPPSAPKITNIIPSNQTLTVVFTPPNFLGNTVIANYVYSTDNGITYSSANTTVSPIIISGLNNGQQYQIVLKAVNIAGESPPSAVSIATPATTPSAPTNLGIIPGNSVVNISFTLPVDDGGSSITNYEYSLNAGISWVEVSPPTTISPLTITSLTNGTTYTIQIRAKNNIGGGTASNSISATPLPNLLIPSTISTLNLWLNSHDNTSIVESGGIVTQWDDRSGIMNNFSRSPSTGTISFSSSSLINNRPAIYFQSAIGSGLQAYLQRTSFNIAPANQLSVFLICLQTARGTGNSSLLYTPLSLSIFHLFNNTNVLGPSGELTLLIGNNTPRNTGQNIITPPRISLISIVSTSTGGSGNGLTDIFINGTQTNNGIVRGVATLNTITTWRLSGAAFIGYIGEVITYGSVLTDSDRQKIEGYLAWKWGTQATLPVGHLYKTSPPS